MGFTVKSNFGDMAKHLRTHAPKADRAARRATRQTLVAIEREQVAEMRKAFRAPVPFTLRALRIWNPTTASADGRIVIRGPRDVSSNVVPEHYLRAQIEGGTRQQKLSEKALQRAGVLPAGWVTVPGNAARLNTAGNMSVGQIREIMAWFEAFSAGSKRNSSVIKRAKKQKGTKSRHGQRYFAVAPGTKGLKPGIYHAQITGNAMGPVSPPRLVLAFVRRAIYRPRYDFAAVSERVAKVVHPAEYLKALQGERDGR